MFYDSTNLKTEIPEKKEGTGLLKKVGLFAGLLVVFGVVLYLGQNSFQTKKNMMIQEEAFEFDDMVETEGDDLEITAMAGSFKLCNKGAFSVEAIKCFQGTSWWNEAFNYEGGIYHLTNPFCKTINFRSDWAGRTDITCRAYIVAACPGSPYQGWNGLSGSSSYSECVSGTTCFLGKSCGGGGCFGENEMITTRNHDGQIFDKKISQLEIEDDVLTYDLSNKKEQFEKVILRAHYHDFDDGNTEYDLIRLHTQNNHSIELSPTHLLYVGEQNPVLKNAESIQIGDSVWFKDQSVQIISKESTKGKYRSVVTESGNILVNDFVASSHTGKNEYDHIVQQKFVVYIDYILSPIFDYFFDAETKEIYYVYIRQFLYNYVVKSIKNYNLSSIVFTFFSIIATSAVCFTTFGFFKHLFTTQTINKSE
jgi:hypothetical protein